MHLIKFSGNFETYYSYRDMKNLNINELRDQIADAHKKLGKKVE